MAVMKLTLAALILCMSVPCMAQTPADAAASAADGRIEPKVQRTVVEDGGARIEELRVRGINRSVVVQSKLLGAPAYRIDSSSDGRDVSQDRRSDGRSLWQLFAF
jgi:hypothetical protein